VNGTQVTFAPAFPTAVFSITLGPARPDGATQVISIDNTTVLTTGFKFSTASSGYNTCYWMAIGN
jgi:hypothetical protein